MSEPVNVQVPQFTIHKRTGAVQFSLKPAYFDGQTYDSKNGKFLVMKRGFLMVEMANATGRTDERGFTLYDWAGKVSMKLSAEDIQQMIAGLKGADCNIVHDPNKALDDGEPKELPNSRLVLKKGEQFGHFMFMSRGENKVKCPLSDTDAATLRVLLSRALVRIFGW